MEYAAWFIGTLAGLMLFGFWGGVLAFIALGAVLEV